MKKQKIEILTNSLWIIFGIFGGFNYYSKAEYWISGIMFLLAILYAFNLCKSLIRNKKQTKNNKN